MALAKKTTPIADRLLVIACGMIAREELAVKERNGLEHLDREREDAVANGVAARDGSARRACGSTGL